jgi:hypothetical protein
MTQRSSSSRAGALAGLVTVAAAACGSDGTAGPIDGAIDGPPPTALDGYWLGACLPRTGPPGTDSSRWGVTYEGDAYTAEQRYAGGADCLDVKLLLIEQGTFAIGGMATAPAGATDIDYRQGAITARTFNGYAATINASGICTGVTFVDGQDISLSGATCAGSPAPTNGSTLLGIFKLGGTSLQLGEIIGLGQVGMAQRPTTLRNDAYTYTP